MAREYDFHVYLMTNFEGTVLYTGVTNDLYRRLWEHQRGEGSKFTTKYHADRLLYFENFDEVTDAIAREKQIKGWTRAKKEKLIATLNPQREDLSWHFDPTLPLPSGKSERDRTLVWDGLAASGRSPQNDERKESRRERTAALEGPSTRLGSLRMTE